MDVFISYSSKEFDKACLVKNTLAKNGISTWMAPDSIPGGSNYTKEIPSAIKACKVFLLILSENAQKSIWVPAETEQAFKHEKLILPFVIDKCEIADEFDFMLSRSQRIDAYEQKADALEKLVTRLKTLLGKPQAQTVNYCTPSKEKKPSDNKYKTAICVDGVGPLSALSKPQTQTVNYRTPLKEKTSDNKYKAVICVDNVCSLFADMPIVEGHVISGKLSLDDEIFVDNIKIADVHQLYNSSLTNLNWRNNKVSCITPDNGTFITVLYPFSHKLSTGDKIYAKQNNFI